MCLSHLGTEISRSTINEHAKVIVFTDSGKQYAAGILDGKVESEIYTTTEDTEPDKGFVLGVLHGYQEVWFPVACTNDCAAVVSADLQYFARIGSSKELNKKYVFWVFTEAWRKFAAERKSMTKV